MPKGPSKSAAAIQRLLEERRQYEAWLARIILAARQIGQPQPLSPEAIRVLMQQREKDA